MLNCATCQVQMLEYLYDLLDGPERQALEAHLADCSACREALAKTQAQQQLLAAAAKLEFAGVSFQPPAPDAVTPTLPFTAVPKRRVAKQPLQWRRWAVAAAVLVAVGGLGWLGAASLADIARQQQTVHEGQLAQTEALRRERQAQAALTTAAAERIGKIEAMNKAVAERELKLVVQGPAAVQPGAPSDYQILTTDLYGQPVAAQVSVQLSDNGVKLGDAIAAKQTADGSYRVTLPPDLPLRPQSNPVLLVSAKRESGKSAVLEEQLELVSKVYLTHLTTDKPMYQPGETVYFRSLTLDRLSLKPADQELRLHYTITTPLGDEQAVAVGGNGLQKQGAGGVLTDLKGPDGKPVKGVGAGAYHLDADTAAGGEYILTVSEEQNRFLQQQRKFIVNKYQKPRLNKELDFNRKTYGPGDEVQGAIKASSNDGTPLTGKSIEATITVDGKQYDKSGKEGNQPLNVTIDAEGKATVRFTLPKEIDKGQANLNLKFQDGANVESLSRSIPIVLKKLNVEFFPEGGDLVAGLNNRVYFTVRTTLGKPADLKGRILKDGKPLDVEVVTLSDDKEPGVNQGMGRFEFKPEANAKYELQIDTPVGMTSKPVLPTAKEEGVVMNVGDGVVGTDGALKVTVRSTKVRNLIVGAYSRGRLLDSVKLGKGQTEATLQAGTGQGGVCRVTVFEEKFTGATRREIIPVAERLVYKQPKEELHLAVKPDKSSYVPGQRVNLALKAVNEAEASTPSIVMLAVVDKSVVTMADEKTARSMPTHFLLTSEVQRPEDLEYADFLLGPQVKAKQALDLLLGTQGWRRFAEQDPNKFREQHKDEAERLLVTIGQTGFRHTDFTREQEAKINDDYETKVEQLQEESQQARSQAQAAVVAAPYRSAQQALANYQQKWDKFVFWAPQVVGVLLMLVAGSCLLLGMRRDLAAARPYYLTAAVSVALLIVTVGLWTLHESPDASRHEMAAMMPRSTTTAATGMVRDEPMKNADRAKFDDQKDARWADDNAALVAPEGKERFGGGKGGAQLAQANKEQLRPFNMPKPGMPMPAMAPLAAAEPGKKAMAKLDAKEKQLGMLGDEMKRAEGLDALQGGVEALRKNFDKDMNRAKMPARALQDRFDGKREQAEARAAERPMINGGGAFGPRGRGEMGGMPFTPPQAPLAPLVVREYAHQRTVGMTPELRSDFTETLYWQPALVLPNGQADVSFDLCDSTTTYQVTAFVHSLDGRLGATTYNFDSRLPFTLQPKLPIEVTSSDKIDVPLSLTNNTGEARKVSVNLKTLDGLALLKGEKNDEFTMESGTPVRRVYRFQPLVKDGEAVLTFEGKTAPFGTDLVRNTFRIVPEGFPFVGTHSDVLEGTSTGTVNLPETWVKGSLKCQVNVYPSTLAELQKGLEGLLREPGGCFEQTSSTNYPNVLILGYLKESEQSKPEIEKRARELLGRGYGMLTSFECTNTGKQKKEGYEWFGGTAPAHEALTAYGLLEFRDMAKVSEVDQQMIERTRQYLMSRRDGKGGFQRNAAAIDTFGRAPQHITDAYIIWALTESGPEDDVTLELDELVKKAKTSKDPYFLALVANSLSNRSRHAEATELLKANAAAQKEDGHLNAESTSITGSGGRDLEIETTALTLLGWLKANNPAAFNANVVKSVKWLGQQRGGYGGFGSTQSTILTLKALIAFTKANKRTPEAGELTLFVGDKQLGKLAFPAGAAEALTLNLDNAEEHLKAGVNKVRVEMTGKNVFPYTLTWSYNTLQPASADKAPVRLTTALAKTETSEGDGVRLSVKVENVSGQGQGMAVAVVGLPGGLTIPEDLKQLKEYTRLPLDGSRPLVSAFEIRGRELVLYWRDLAPGQKIEVPVDLTCRVPGEYSGPASRAYLYYNADLKHWVEPLKVNIAAK